MINVWNGRGIWDGWRIRKDYNLTKYSESILVDPEGNTYGPNDIMACKSIINNNVHMQNREEEEGHRSFNPFKSKGDVFNYREHRMDL